MSRRNKIFMSLFCIGMALLLLDYVKARREIWGILPQTVEATGIPHLWVRKGGFSLDATGTTYAVLELSDSAAHSIAEGGVLWLNAQPGGRIVPDWQSTPVPRTDFWTGLPDSKAGSWPDPTILAVRENYAILPIIPRGDQTALDAALNAPGSFYAFGPGGLVAVIVPATRRAYVFYAG